ncbi:putative bifunctional diguanylate cyclase/phosphodiesterase [Saccharothrix texasensis]|uniref:PAS domain S-box-containing protein/diguanylate cyclase (GGDEF)-like protein n=1 Tax=Saccharothrix texasensis TaxID=103734 RepID=A0A3N1GZ44_9PSEU|nr:diguanylate cyclase [Saccharothrix texasensis]ROP35232.1 PAS domain S-box-containing protein/diguanylate cyclase (GGDEF)-like protein [Saccharothrix texasensis]
MTAALPQDADGPRARTKLAKKWAYLLSSRTFVPLTNAELERQLLGLVERLCAGVAGESPAQRTGREVGVALVDLNCATAEALQVSVEILTKGLLAVPALTPPDRLRERVVDVIASLSAGFVDKVRATVLAQQEQLGRSLYKAMREAQVELQYSEARFELLEHHLSTGIATADPDGTLVRSNGALARIVDRPPAELAGSSLFELAHPDERVALRADFGQLADSGTASITQPRQLVRGDGEPAWVMLTLSPLRRLEGRAQVVVLVEDATDVNLLQGQLNHQALHDVLTRLPNRQFFTSRLEQALRTADPGTGVSVFHLDLDGFSRITGGLGREVGDHVLKVVAGRLQAVMAEENAMVARFGHDEFAILVENTPTTPDVVTTVRRINNLLSAPFHSGGARVAVSATIGVVHRPPRDSAPSDLLDSADLTLRRARGNGRRQWELSDPAQDGRDRRAFSLAATMPGAWANGELQVLYRPVVRLADGQVESAEAVLRWDHPTLGALPHEQCLALAEDTGLIVPLGTWALRTAGEQARSWRRELGRDLPVRWALSPSQAADPDLHGVVRDALAATGLPASSLRLGAPGRALFGGERGQASTGQALPGEALAGERGEAADTLKYLAEDGVGVEVEDFTAAPDDLARLLDGVLPVRAVRLAQSPASRPGSAVARALAGVLEVVRDAGVGVTAADVTTPEQARWWREVGADTASGPLFAPAGPPDVITR